MSNPVPLPDLYFDSFSYPVASIVFGNMAIVSLFLLLFFLANPRSCLERYRLALSGQYTHSLGLPAIVSAVSSFPILFSLPPPPLNVHELSCSLYVHSTRELGYACMTYLFFVTAADPESAETDFCDICTSACCWKSEKVYQISAL